MAREAMLDRISIAAPCSADWDAMPGTERVRFCEQCGKNVYNLSAMTRRQAERLLRESEGRLCTRLYRRADGTVITENCTVGLRAMGQRISRVAGAVMSAAMTFSAAAFAQGPIIQISGAAQQGSQALASVTGVVQDSSGTVMIENSRVVATDVGTQRQLHTVTDDKGRFRIDSLVPGTYDVRIEATGFTSFTKRVSLVGRQEFKLSATLHLGTTGGPIFVSLR